MMAHDPSLWAGGAALHALDPDEARTFEAHAETCPICRPELAEFRETVARLGAALAETPPASLRAGVLSGITLIRQLPPLVTVDTLPTEGLPVPPEAGPPVETTEADADADERDPVVVPFERPAGRHRVVRRTWLLAAAAIVAIVAAVGATFVIGRSTEQADPLRECLTTASDQRSVAATPVSVGASTAIVSASCGAAQIEMSEMPALPAGSTYQLWVLTGAEARSVTTYEPNADGTLPSVVTAVHLGDTAIGLTVEPAGGSPAPTTDPVVVVPLV